MSKKIMFNDTYALTQAVLDGTKTMTRRIEKPKQKARRWKQKKWFKVRNMEDLCDPRARLIPIYSSGGGKK